MRAISTAILFLFLLSGSAFAGSAKWKPHPHIPYWSEAASWDPQTVPNGPNDIATFGLTYRETVHLIYSATVNSIVFTPEATTAYSIDLDQGDLTITGAGITNNSGNTVTFWPINGKITFTNTASAGSLIDFVGLGTTEFLASSTAGDNTFTCDVDFFDNASASQGTFTIQGGRWPVQVSFNGHSTAANATLTNEGGLDNDYEIEGGTTSFLESSTAENAFLTANEGTSGGNGGLIEFAADSMGGQARIQLNGNGLLKIDNHNVPGVTIGSIEGDGLVSLGENSLTVGNNGLSTTFSGLIQGTGSIVKIGTGNLTLENANTYTGGTVVNDGILLANGPTNSNTGSGPVLATAGTFGGGGKVTGPVTIGTGSGLGAILAPGTVGVVPGTFSIGKNLQLLADATLKVLIDSASQTMDKVVAKGIRIRRAQIVFSDRNANVLPAGTSFTAIDNISTKPISGTFLNLPDGGTVTVGNNIFQANYEGGDGNDLTLTVVSL